LIRRCANNFLGLIKLMLERSLSHIVFNRKLIEDVVEIFIYLSLFLINLRIFQLDHR
jgi:hypothetical protein